MGHFLGRNFRKTAASLYWKNKKAKQYTICTPGKRWYKEGVQTVENQEEIDFLLLVDICVSILFKFIQIHRKLL